VLVLLSVRVAQKMAIGPVEHIVRRAVRETSPADTYGLDYTTAAELGKDQIRVELVCGVLGVGLDAAHVVGPCAVNVHHEVPQLAPELLAERLPDPCVF
jgi:hypothetical protein